MPDHEIVGCGLNASGVMGRSRGPLARDTRAEESSPSAGSGKTGHAHCPCRTAGLPILNDSYGARAMSPKGRIRSFARPFHFARELAGPPNSYFPALTPG